MDRGRENSRALTEIRTVRSRAETALSDIDLNGENPWGEQPRVFDPDREEMVAALRAFITATDKWKRTGRTKYKDGDYR